MSYNVQYPYHLINAVSMAATITSAAQNIITQDNVGLQLNWTGTPVGTFSVQVSNDHAENPLGNVTVAGNWTTLTLSASVTAAGSADTAFIDINQSGAYFLRVVYTRTSGTGTLNCYLTAKGV